MERYIYTGQIDKWIKCWIQIDMYKVIDRWSYRLIERATVRQIDTEMLYRQIGRNIVRQTEDSQIDRQWGERYINLIGTKTNLRK